MNSQAHFKDKKMKAAPATQLKSIYAATCICGKTNFVEYELEPFTCSKCGIVGIIDFTRFTKGELTQVLDDVMNKADHLAKVVEIRRQRIAS
jgi:hypothetical protein